MARKQTQLLTVDAVKAQQDREFLEAMATDLGGDDKTRARAKLILAMMAGAGLETGARQAGISLKTAKEKLRQFNAGGWKSLLDSHGASWRRFPRPL